MRIFGGGLDGKGPAVQWGPRFFRPRLNEWFRRNGWAVPYDDELKKIPRSERQVPTDTGSADDSEGLV